MGTLIAWVIVRDNFLGRSFVEVVIDIPFALPTIVAGLASLAWFGPTSPRHQPARHPTRRAVRPAVHDTAVRRTDRRAVLIALDTDVEQAAASLGAGPLTMFRRIVLPAILPAIASGTALAFARAMGEYGSVR